MNAFMQVDFRHYHVVFVSEIPKLLLQHRHLHLPTIVLRNIQADQEPAYHVVRANGNLQLHNLLILAKQSPSPLKNLIAHSNLDSALLSVLQHRLLQLIKSFPRPLLRKHLLQLLGRNTRLEREHGVRLPLVHGVGQHGDVADAQLHDGLAERGLGADRPDEAVVAVCYARVVQEGQVERDQRPRVSAGGDALVDGFILARRVGRGGRGVRDAHGLGLGGKYGRGLGASEMKGL